MFKIVDSTSDRVYADRLDSDGVYVWIQNNNKTQLVKNHTVVKQESWFGIFSCRTGNGIERMPAWSDDCHVIYEGW